MINIHQYFDIIHSTIIHSMTTDYEVEYLPVSQTEGYIEGVLYFADESRLEFTERVEIRSRRPKKKSIVTNISKVANASWVMTMLRIILICPTSLITSMKPTALSQ